MGLDFLNYLKIKNKNIFFMFLAFILPILIVLLFWLLLPKEFRINENSDYINFYEPVAKNILDGKGYVTKNGTFSARYPIGFPLLLSGVFFLSRILNISQVYMIRLFILFCVGVSSIFIFLLARMFYENKKALISSLAWVSYPPILWLTKQPNSETPFMLFFFIGIYLLFRAYCKKSSILFLISGLFFGYFILIRPIALGVGITISLTFIVLKKKFFYDLKIFFIILFLLGQIFVILPWEIFVYRKTGKIVLISTAGLPTIKDGLTFLSKPKGYRKPLKLPKDVELLSSDILKNEDKLNSVYKIAQFLKDEIKTRPKAVFSLFLIKFLRSWFATDSHRFENLIIPMQIFYFIIFSIASYLGYKEKNIKKLLIIIWTIVLYFWIITTLALPILRYMVPAISLLFVFVPAVFINKIYAK